jgi:hypothetical protein
MPTTIGKFSLWTVVAVIAIVVLALLLYNNWSPAA